MEGKGRMLGVEVMNRVIENRNATIASSHHNHSPVSLSLSLPPSRVTRGLGQLGDETNDARRTIIPINQYETHQGTNSERDGSKAMMG